MAIKQCKECGKEVSSQAKQCPHCGAPQKKPFGIGRWLLIALAAFIFYALIQGNDGAPVPSNAKLADAEEQASAESPAAPPPEVLNTAPLEVKSWHCDREHDYVFVRGEVKNVTANKLENVVAVGEFRTKGGDLVKSEDALLEYNPIMPGQTSPFSAGGTDNPQISTCHVAFKHLFGGEIPFVDKKKRK